MGKRHPNHRIVKIHRNYTVEEAARLLGKHKNTVRNWIKNGLATIDDKRPILIFGHDLVEFIKKRRAKNKQSCKPGQLYCVKCRVPKFPAGDLAEYSPITEKFGNLIAICPDCDCIMNRRVSLARVGEVFGNIDITFPKELQHIVKRSNPSVNSDLR
jgi:hypothetical protein